MKGDISVGIREVTKHMTLGITVRVTGQRTYRLRLWLGTRLLKLAGRVIGFGTINLEVDNGPQ